MNCDFIQIDYDDSNYDRAKQKSGRQKYQCEQCGEISYFRDSPHHGDCGNLKRIRLRRIFQRLEFLLKVPIDTVSTGSRRHLKIIKDRIEEEGITDVTKWKYDELAKDYPEFAQREYEKVKDNQLARKIADGEIEVDEQTLSKDIISLVKRYRESRKKFKESGEKIRKKEDMEYIYNEICKPCPHFNDSKLTGSSCKLCGCRLHPTRLTLNKLAYLSEQCGHNPPKWKAGEESLKTTQPPPPPPPPPPKRRCCGG